MRPPKGLPVYDLIDSQKMVQYMWRYTLHTQATQIPFAVAFDEALDFELLARAVNTEIARNDCLRLRVFRDGLRLRQFFLPEYRLDNIPRKAFASRQEQEDCLNADAARKLDVFRGETFRVILFSTHDGKCGVYLNVSHMAMDAMAAFIFFRDLMEVYDCLKTGAPLPKPMGSYEAIIRQELNDEGHAAFVERETAVLEEWIKKDRPPTFCGLNGPKALDRERKLRRDPNATLASVYSPLFDTVHCLKLRLSKADSAAIDAFVEKHRVSPEWVVQLGLRIRLSQLNRRVNDTTFWVLCPRRRTVTEKRCGGTLASPMPWREILPGETTFRQALAQMAQSQAFLFRHADVPFTAMRNSERRLFRANLMQSPNSMMFSYLPLSENTFGGRRYEFTGYNFGHYVIPVYTLALRDPSAGCYAFTYIHRTHLHTDEEVRRFHEGAVRAILSGISDPDKTINDIMEEL